MMPLAFAVSVVLVVAIFFVVFRRVRSCLLWAVGLVVILVVLGFLFFDLGRLSVGLPGPVEAFLSIVETLVSSIVEIVGNFFQFFSGVLGSA